MKPTTYCEEIFTYLHPCSRFKNSPDLFCKKPVHLLLLEQVSDLHAINQIVGFHIFLHLWTPNSLYQCWWWWGNCCYFAKAFFILLKDAIDDLDGWLYHQWKVYDNESKYRRMWVMKVPRRDDSSQSHLTLSNISCAVSQDHQIYHRVSENSNEL